MNKILVFVASYLLPIALLAQTDDAQKYASTITSDDLKKNLTIVASAEMEGRETGTPGQRRAAAFIESQFKLLGLQAPEQLNGYQQSFPIYKDTLLNTSLKIGKKNYVFGNDFILNPSAAENGEVRSNQIIFVGYGIVDSNYNDYADKDVTGKIVVFFTGEPKANGVYTVTGTSKSSPWNFGGTAKKAAAAKQNGALAALVINPAMEIFYQELLKVQEKPMFTFQDKQQKKWITLQ